MCLSGGGGIWTHDLEVMTLASYRTALPRDIYKRQFLTGCPAREKEVNKHLTVCVTRPGLEPGSAAWKAAILDLLDERAINGRHFICRPPILSCNYEE